MNILHNGVTCCCLLFYLFRARLEFYCLLGRRIFGVPWHAQAFLWSCTKTRSTTGPYCYSDFLCFKSGSEYLPRLALFRQTFGYEKNLSYCSWNWKVSKPFGLNLLTTICFGPYLNPTFLTVRNIEWSFSPKIIENSSATVFIYFHQETSFRLHLLTKVWTDLFRLVGAKKKHLHPCDLLGWDSSTR